MKQSIKVSINTISFNIDDDAYKVLDNYLSSLKQHFAETADTKEIISDIEMRIAELLQMRLNTPEGVVSYEDVAAIINIMGNPEDFAETEENEATEKKTNSTRERILDRPEKRLYRDMDNKTIAGVCSGLSHFLKIDVVIFRILFILLFIVGVMFIDESVGMIAGVTLTYLILWISMPRALTFEQKVKMTGAATTIAHISDRSGGSQSKGYKGSFVREFLKIIFRTILIIVGIISILFVACLIAFFVWVSFDTSILDVQNYFDFFGIDSFSFKLALGLFIALPVLGFINMIVKLYTFSSFKTQNFILLLVGFGIWVGAGSYIASQIAPWAYKYQYSNSVSEVAELNTSSDVLYIELDKSYANATQLPSNPYMLYKDDGDVRNLTLLPHQIHAFVDSTAVDQNFKVELRTTIHAESWNKVNSEVSITKLDYSATDSLLTISPKWYNKNEPWDRKITRLYITVPYGKQVKVLGYLNEISKSWVQYSEAVYYD